LHALIGDTPSSAPSMPQYIVALALVDETRIDTLRFATV
jgi:hypothetical protein